MKAAIVVPYFTPYVRGNEFGLADGLAKLGVDVTILASKGKAPREKMVTDRTDVSQQLRFKVKYLPTLLDKGEIPFTPTVFFEILRGGYDVVLLQEDYQPICHMAGIAAKLKGIPTILSTERTYLPTGLKAFVLALFDMTINALIRKTATVYTAHCTAAKEFMETRLRVPKGRIRVINVGVDTELFKPTQGETPLTEGSFKILTVARLHPYKGLDNLISAMESVNADMPGAILYIMGRGPEAERLKSIAKDYGIEDFIKFIESPVPNYMMPAIYTSADIYVQPSIQEPFGIAVLEAMACGKPVIGTRTGGMTDTIEERVTGFLQKPGDRYMLDDRIIQLAKDRDLAAAMGYNGRKRAVEKFDWSVIARQYLDVMEKLVK